MNNKTPSNNNLQITTKGNQSPAVIGEEVSISYRNEKDNQRDSTESNN